MPLQPRHPRLAARRLVVHSTLVAALGVATAASGIAPAAAQGPPPRVQYPATHTVDTVTDYFGTRVADP